MLPFHFGPYAVSRCGRLSFYVKRMKKDSLIALAFWAALMFLGYGITLGAFVMIGFMAVLMTIADYFSTRDHSKPPSTAERTFAYIWV